MHLPHLQSFSKQPLVFLTVCVAQRRTLLGSESSHQILKSVWEKCASVDDWYIGRYLLMPDHVHFFARPGFSARALPDWMKSWKSVSSRQLLVATGTAAPLWQADYFDHFIRSAASYQEKWDYVLNNPVRAGLCSDQAAWPYRGVLHDLEFA